MPDTEPACLPYARERPSARERASGTADNGRLHWETTSRPLARCIYANAPIHATPSSPRQPFHVLPGLAIQCRSTACKQASTDILLRTWMVGESKTQASSRGGWTLYIRLLGSSPCVYIHPAACTSHLALSLSYSQEACLLARMHSNGSEGIC